MSGPLGCDKCEAGHAPIKSAESGVVCKETTCPAGQRFNLETGDCDQCADQNCLSCSASIDQCESCAPDFLLEDGKCVPDLSCSVA